VRASNFCFTTLALGERYRRAALELASDLATNAPGKQVVVLTDDPRVFERQRNVVAVQHHQKGLFNCWNDKRFAVTAAFQFGDPVIFYDADSRVSKPLPRDIQTFAPLSADWTPNLEEHTIRYQNKKERDIIFKVCESFGVDPKASVCIADSFYVIRKDQGREITFLRIWGKVAEQFDLLGICPSDGWSMGIAAAVIGWHASQGDPEISAFNSGRTHFLFGRESWKQTKPYWRRGVQRIINSVSLLWHRLTFAFKK
jgi:hypothetical protein